MKFDVVVGNPPYQESRQDTLDYAIYNYFYDLAEKVGSKYCLITPARFLFNAGSTDKKWNRKMLNDQHIKVEYFEQDSAKVFANTDIKGGVAVVYRDDDSEFGPIGIFTSHRELNSIVNKVDSLTQVSLSTIITGQGLYLFTDKMHEDHPEVASILPKSHQFDISTGVFGTLDKIVFFADKPADGEEYIVMLGRFHNTRVYRWIRKDYVNQPKGFDKWRVLLPNANGSGQLGEVISNPIVEKPFVGFTQTFLSVGHFDEEAEAKNALRYIKTKFARILLGVLKITQHNPAPKWKYVPLQDFTSDSDIDWALPIPEIDQQLYEKYGLDKSEIDFIESKAKRME